MCVPYIKHTHIYILVLYITVKSMLIVLKEMFTASIGVLAVIIQPYYRQSKTFNVSVRIVNNPSSSLEKTDE